jgi:hypothetical protein
MIIKQRIPMEALQTALYTVLAANQATPVYDNIPRNAAPDYITFGSYTWKANGAKAVAIGDATLNVHIYSSSKGKKVVNQIANAVASVVSAVVLDLSATGFRVLSQWVDMIEAFPDDESDGYHAVITVAAKIQDMGGV